jgi:adenosylmethionine-8-amino-7-oxononanoate aminotransferase
VLENNVKKASYLQSKMQVLTDLPIQNLRHQGMISAFDVITNNPEFSRACYSQALQQGLLLRPIGNTVYFMPPYTINETEIDFMVNATQQVLQATI